MVESSYALPVIVRISFGRNRAVAGLSTRAIEEALIQGPSMLRQDSVVRRSLSEVHLIYRCGTANNRCFSGVLAQPSGEMSVNSRTSKEASRRTKTSAPFLCAVVDSVFVVGTVRLVGFRILKCDLEKPSHRIVGRRL
ncbi:hypothetical protein AVEN_201724-1 [Araneus ventricosus]|uniref:Uncharacterized protein n=1 Tax=Araneus ventricosus TaxID=182803 RepID=A0A4Y2M0D4_ARAVE|nr:hypothetical protein AVEN_259210-1 [Araneus ventricosus]GBN20044.1 hypothetical protein AVEN_41086-1 [Araneus ventricosus]GBN20067.1 hypothetical protein AVEN_57956-1 [Araneus ventricosus]GBN20149.1 hypothetical protein AVEN_201724-1 [Araneus ventricosus]